MVSTHGNNNSLYAPINEQDTKGGLIKYLNQGADSVIEARREDAYMQMHSFCNGAYQIVSEGPRNEGGIAAPVGRGFLYSESQYWYISFKCV